MARSRRRLKGRFYLILLAIAGVIGIAVFLILGGGGRGQINFGGVETDMTLSGALIRDESVVLSEPFEKIVFNVVEGQTVNNNDLIAQVYKRGYQDETMTSFINLQRDIYTYQMQLLGESQPQELIDINNNIATVEQQIRDTSRGDADLDMLTLEQTLKNLQTERITLLQSIIPGDGTLSNMYQQMNDQQTTQLSWKRDIRNEGGTGIVSFYFDGYEQVLSVNKLSTINAALVNSVVKGGNTASTTASNSESPLYRIINNTHWYLAFVTKAADSFRLASGEQYSVEFTNFSDQVYTATALDTTISENSVVNILEFHTDIGKLAGVRTVECKITKSAQGLVVPIKAIEMVNGVPGINVNFGDTPLRVEVDILSQDEKQAVIRARNGSDTLTAGQKYIKP